MSEEITKEEIEEALSLLNGDSVTIEPARRKVVRHKGRMIEVEEAAYVKFSTAFKKELADLSEHALKVFLYIGLSIGFETGTAHPGTRKIAEDTGMAQNTVTKAIQELEEKGFLDVYRREGTSNIYTPIRYISIGKTASPNEAVSNISDEPPHEDAEPPHENEEPPHDSTVNLHNQINKNNQKDLSLTGEEIEQANHKVDMILKLNQKSAFQWRGRDFFNDNVLHYADWYFNKTGQIPGKNKKSWVKAFSDWQDSSLSLEDLEQARIARLKWKEFISDPNELTKDASAIKAQKNITPSESPRPTGTGFYA